VEGGATQEQADSCSCFREREAICSKKKERFPTPLRRKEARFCESLAGRRKKKISEKRHLYFFYGLKRKWEKATD